MERKFNILLAEDDKNLGSILKSYLEAKGFDATLCENGKIALDAFKKGDFDFGILDVMMPVMDGFTLAKEIRKISKNSNRYICYWSFPKCFLTITGNKNCSC